MERSFRIYYADGSVFGSEDGSWDEAPVSGVIMVVLKTGERIQFFSGSDYYVSLDKETIAQEDTIDPILREYCPWIKHGVWTTHKQFRLIQERARQEFKGV